MIPGNQKLQSSLRDLTIPTQLVKHRSTVVALVGDRFLGQKSVAVELYRNEIHEADFIEMEPGVDGSREVVEFSMTSPVGSSVKVILVDNADRLSEPSQDALLKLLESPPSLLSIVLVAYDTGALQPALASRIRSELRWDRVSLDEMYEYASSLLLPVSDTAVKMAMGLPELYRIIVENGGFDELYDSIVSVAKREVFIMAKPPRVICDLENGHNDTRDAVIHVIRYACKQFFHDYSASLPILRFCSVLSSSTSANAEIHWTRMIADTRV